MTSRTASRKTAILVSFGPNNNNFGDNNNNNNNNNNNSGYRVEARWSSDEREYQLMPEDTELKIPDLKADCNYRFRIQAINERGASPFSGNHRVFLLEQTS